ncbi:hypothetical protein ABIC33_006213 [Variovorax sp. 1140]|uniref:hypothetical protein n=1 Tax=Variovorax atrisoli TaxID=3394203 RepID=UPI00339384E1
MLTILRFPAPGTIAPTRVAQPSRPRRAEEKKAPAGKDIAASGNIAPRYPCQWPPRPGNARKNA